MSTCPHIQMSTCSHVHMSTCPNVHMSTYPLIHMSRTPPPVQPARTTGHPIDLVIYVYTNNQILVKVYLDKGRVSDAQDSSETLDYEVFVIIN